MCKHLLWIASGLLLVTGCHTRHDVNMRHEVEPIEITLNINLKVDRELDDFFSEIDEAAATDLATKNPSAEEK